ncbi:uncharacterized protein DUF1702 [Paenibacillus cellulosilyticus]|uniref:Uncharacterized protein DUF1702 n=1 Tax=Paenibacillus cellulosilyticus TaxID=375489 RepID=A0A2V2YU74_9BACL|nr:DUF1702 family protein [Paenibacillus cellulosilyticus]PWW03241.1 uncharacterized protein DUF1702 [Paenibacillus cellulosilyticus]QKS43728.1 DUF1702 family protein [Paenibacillus cellulosilyticus]
MMTEMLRVAALVAVVIGFPLLYLRMFQVNIPSMVRRFKTAANENENESEASYGIRFPKILRAFLSGNNRVIRPIIRLEKARDYLEDFDPFYKGFAYEGAGMGFGVKASLWPNKSKRFERYIRALDPNYLYQYYVGLGWWLHTRYGYRDARYNSWLRTLDPRYASIVFDGIGFKAALFDYPDNPHAYLRFAHFPLSYRRVCLQGYGRGLWFSNYFSLSDAITAVEQLPVAYRRDAYSGLGLAVAYSYFDRLPFAFEALDQVPAFDQTAFYQGMAFGWEARQLQNASYWEEMLGRFPEEAASRARRAVELVHEAEKRIAKQTDHDRPYYVRWMDEMRYLLNHQ